MLIYTDIVQQIVTDIAVKVREMHHLDPDRIGVLATARAGGLTMGNLATCYGLKRNGVPSFSIWTRARSRQIIAVSEWFRYVTPRVRLHGHDMSYLILLRLPRLLHRNPLTTLVHELYHISEGFDCEMRPVKHGQYFNSQVRRISDIWLRNQRGELARLAQMRFVDLQKEFGAVLAHGVPGRFTVPLIEPAEAPEDYEEAVERLYPGYRLAPRYEIYPAPQGSETALRQISEKDLVLRHYSWNGCEKVPSAFARYSRQYLPLPA